MNQFTLLASARASLAQARKTRLSAGVVASDASHGSAERALPADERARAFGNLSRRKLPYLDTTSTAPKPSNCETGPTPSGKRAHARRPGSSAVFDHEYTLVAHPRFRAQLSYRREGAELGAATVRLDYRRDDEWTEDRVAVDLPESVDGSTVEWRGLRLALYRDGERVGGDTGSDARTSSDAESESERAGS